MAQPLCIVIAPKKSEQVGDDLLGNDDVDDPEILGCLDIAVHIVRADKTQAPCVQGEPEIIYLMDCIAPVDQENLVKVMRMQKFKLFLVKDV